MLLGPSITLGVEQRSILNGGETELQRGELVRLRSPGLVETGPRLESRIPPWLYVCLLSPQ